MKVKRPDEVPIEYRVTDLELQVTITLQATDYGDADRAADVFLRWLQAHTEHDYKATTLEVKGMTVVTR